MNISSKNIWLRPNSIFQVLNSVNNDKIIKIALLNYKKIVHIFEQKHNCKYYNIFDEIIIKKNINYKKKSVRAVKWF